MANGRHGPRRKYLTRHSIKTTRFNGQIIAIKLVNQLGNQRRSIKLRLTAITARNWRLISLLVGNGIIVCLIVRGGGLAVAVVEFWTACYS